MGSDTLMTRKQEWMGIFMHHSMRNFIRYAKDNGLSLSQCGALIHLQHEGIAGVTDMGDHLGVSSAGASQMLDRLVHQDLIQRTEDPCDRRGKQIILTDKGHRILHEAIRARASWLKDVFDALSDEEQEQIVSVLDTLISRASQLGYPKESEHGCKKHEEQA
jgi:DNA-binding MarR family transcriptional regulator